MASTILLKRGSGVPPANKLTPGELAVDQGSGKVYTKTTGGAVVEVGGGGGGGGVGMKLTSQPMTVGTFTHKLNNASSARPPYAASRYESQSMDNFTPNPKHLTFPIPAGKNFLLHAIKGEYQPFNILLGSINIDGELIYPGTNALLPVGDGASYGAADWPGGGHGHNDSKYYGDYVAVPIIVESQISLTVDVNTVSGGSVIAIHGFFVKA